MFIMSDIFEWKWQLFKKKLRILNLVLIFVFVVFNYLWTLTILSIFLYFILIYFIWFYSSKLNILLLFVTFFYCYLFCLSFIPTPNSLNALLLPVDKKLSWYVYQRFFPSNQTTLSLSPSHNQAINIQIDERHFPW